MFYTTRITSSTEDIDTQSTIPSPLQNVQENPRRPLCKYFHSPTRLSTLHSHLRSRASDKPEGSAASLSACSRSQKVE